MSDRFPYNLPSRAALCVEIRKLSKYVLIQDDLVTFEDIFFSPTPNVPGRTFIEMIDLRTGDKSWFVYRRLNVGDSRAVNSETVITLTERPTPRRIVEELNRSRNMTFGPDDFDMSDDYLEYDGNYLEYDLKALYGSYAYYGSTKIRIYISGTPTDARLSEDGTPRLLEDGTFRVLE